MNKYSIRSVLRSDIAKLKIVLDETQLFPSTMLDEMIEPFFEDAQCRAHWLTCDLDDQAVALLYCIPEMMTEGTWNVLAIAVKPEFQSHGIGEQMMSHIEQSLIASGEQTLIVETSSLPEYDRTRQFYQRIGYCREACIRDFYAKGEHKIVFWKSLN